ncbi:MAG: hypothetical protein JSW34_12315 [Candidatus Zixiibacteriota bacterium]|nr:MAG: hypothetical protein JSW34_12315 [candidate division Zixibacteria bacterium]
MSTIMEPKTLHFGLRDFLLYFFPGSIALVGVLLFFFPLANIVSVTGEDLGRVLLFLLVAYFLGHAIYPISLPLRRWLAPGGWIEEDPEFSHRHSELLNSHEIFYVAIIFRDRSLTRFTIAMVTPTAIASVALALDIASREGYLPGGAAILAGMLVTYGFIYRFRHYHERYKKAVFGLKQRTVSKAESG